MSTAVLALQEQLPRARIVYCSATGVSEVGNMAYMSRLVGTWSEQCLLLSLLPGALASTGKHRSQGWVFETPTSRNRAGLVGHR